MSLTSPFCALSLCSGSRTSSLWPLLTTFQRGLSLNVFYLILHLSSSLVMLPAAYPLRKHVVVVVVVVMQ